MEAVIRVIMIIVIFAVISVARSKAGNAAKRGGQNSTNQPNSSARPGSRGYPSGNSYGTTPSASTSGSVSVTAEQVLQKLEQRAAEIAATPAKSERVTKGHSRPDEKYDASIDAASSFVESERRLERKQLRERDNW